MRGKSFSLLLLGILIVLIAIYMVGPKEVLREASKLNTRYFTALLVLQLSCMVLQAVKWKVALRRIRVGFLDILPISFMGFLVNNITPVSMVSGEPVRAYALAKRHNVPTEEASASVIVDLFFQVMPALALVVIGVMVGIVYETPSSVIGVMLLGGFLVLTLALFTMGLLFNEKLTKGIIKNILRLGSRLPIKSIREQAERASGKLDDISSNFRNTLADTMKDRDVILTGVTISTIAWSLSLLRTYVAFIALGIPISVHALVLVRVTVVMISFLSLIPGELGIWEGTSTWLYTFFGIGAPAAMAVTLVDRFFSYWLGSLVGFMATAYLGVGYAVRQEAPRQY